MRTDHKKGTISNLQWLECENIVGSIIIQVKRDIIQLIFAASPITSERKFKRRLTVLTKPLPFKTGYITSRD
jgi:hypothetical protein